jgi:hypothetical protein
MEARSQAVLPRDETEEMSSELYTEWVAREDDPSAKYVDVEVIDGEVKLSAYTVSLNRDYTAGSCTLLVFA